MDGSPKDLVIRLTPSDLQRAKNNLRPPVRIPDNDLRVARLQMRQRRFHEVEPVPFQQQFLGTEVSGRRVNSCTVASALIAMTRIGEIKGRDITPKLVTLEEDLISQAVQRGDFNFGADLGISTTSEVFIAFGLQNGYARNMAELDAALRTGGSAVMSYDGHARVLAEESAGGKQFKEFNPLRVDSQLLQRQLIEQKFQLYNGGITSNVIVVYPSGYVPNVTNGETCRPGIIRSTPFKINPENYLR